MIADGGSRSFSKQVDLENPKPSTQTLNPIHPTNWIYEGIVYEPPLGS